MENTYSKKDLEKATADGEFYADIKQIKRDVASLNEKVDKNLVTKEELATYKAEVAPYIMAVKGMLTIIVSAVIVAIVYLVIKK